MKTLLYLFGFIISASIGAIAFMKQYKIKPWEEEDETTPPPPPAPPVEPVPPVSHETEAMPTLEQFCTAIRDFEGTLPTDANYRNNNPGNAKFSPSGYLPIYQPVGKSPAGFAIFKDYATGWLYLKNLVKSIVKNHPNLTIHTFIGGDGKWPGYAPAGDSNPVMAYASFIAKRLKVTPDFPMKKILGITTT